MTLKQIPSVPPASSRAPFKKKEGPTEVDVHVGGRLRERRMIMGMTQESIATAAGLTFQQIQKYEQGKNRVSASRLLQLARLLTVDPNFFFTGLLEPARGAVSSYGLAEEQDTFQSPDIMSTKETIELIRAYYAVRDPKIRKNVLKIIKKMAEDADK